MRAYRFKPDMLNGHPGDINRACKRLIVRAHNAGLVVTSTTDGTHATTSYHYRGMAVDFGTPDGTPGNKARFQRWCARRPGYFLELYGPDNAANVKNGQVVGLTEGTDLEQAHDTHVHGAPSKPLPLLTLPKPFRPKPKPKPQPTPKPVAVKVRESPDVSMHQGSIDWPKVGNAADFVVMKATEGLTFVDPTFTAERVRQARAAGLIVGYYHFARPQFGRTGDDEAAFFTQTVKSRGGAKKGDLRLVLDLEATKVGPEETHKFAERFCSKVHELTGENAIVYTGPSFWNDQVGGRPAPRHGGALWVAHYTPAGAPADVRGFDEWVFWQYTSSGTIPGINGRVDLNRFNGTRARLDAYRLG